MNEIVIKMDDFQDYLKKEIPVILQENPEVTDRIYDLMKKRFAAEREKSGDRIDRVLQELKQDREYYERRWEESKLHSEKKWEESKLHSDKKWEESRRQWEESKQQFAEMLQEIKDLRIEHNKLCKKHDDIENEVKHTVGSLGSRWGVDSEASFRNGLKAILENRFGVKVENFCKIDEEGIVFPRPDQVEMDIIIFNGDIIACEIKSSLNQSDIYTFERKVIFYEKLNNCRVTTKMIISPMVDKRASEAAEYMGIKVYSRATEVSLQGKRGKRGEEEKEGK